MGLVKSNRLLAEVKSFLQRHYISGKPLLLGYSGGYDSELLLHLLLSLKEECLFDLHVAHLDHGWREESYLESLLLKEKVEKSGCIFHLKRLEKKTSEEEAREERFFFFEELFAKHPYQALLLAHQKNDLAETVFKRFLEGAHLPFLYGMEEIGQINTMPIWRPLLSISKKEILASLQELHLTAIDDATNRDSSYLRARMREEILPSLEKLFGKSILQNLYEASLRSVELKEYLDRKTKAGIDSLLRGPFGLVLPIFSLSSLETIEKKHLLKRMAQEERIDLSRSSLHQILSWIEEEKNHAHFLTKEALFVLDRGSFFIETRAIPPFEGELQLREGNWENGWWQISICRQKERGENKNSWRDFWENKASLFLPQGEYSLKLPTALSSCWKRSSLKKWWQENKTPSFLRNPLPVIYQKEKVVGEFLSGRSLLKEEKAPFWQISLKLSKEGN